MDLRRQFRAKYIVLSSLSVLTIALSIFLLIGRGIGELPTVRLINVVVDIFGMIMGYVISICCVIDVQKTGKSLDAFLALLFTDFAAMFADECAWLVDGNASWTVWNVLSNTVMFVTTPLLAYLFWRYAVAILHLDHEKTRIWNRIYGGGFLCAVALRVLNLFNGMYFTVDAEGVYARGKLHALSYVYCYLLLIITLGLVWRERRKLRRVQVFALFLYVFIPMLVGLSSVFWYGISVANATIMLTILLMYCMVNVVQGREQMMADRELAMAANIQENILPQVFPPYPDRKEFELYASMTPAKEVGGDFYDFFLIDEDHLALVIADVSGKGIPAALFMMVSKVLLKTRVLAGGGGPVDILTDVNRQLNEGNKLEMFVTVWLGILTISTGELRYANAGHEYPAVSRAGGKFVLLKEKHSLPLAVIDEVSFQENTITLSPGDAVYVYTDGVTEARNTDDTLFGTERMLDALNRNNSASPRVMDQTVREAIGEFQGEMPQFDDITMLGLRYNG